MHKFGASPPRKRFKCGRKGCEFVADSDRKLRIHLTKSGHTTSNQAELADRSEAQPLQCSGRLLQLQLVSLEQESEQAQAEYHETYYGAGIASEACTTHVEPDSATTEVVAQHYRRGEGVQGGTRSIQLDPLTGRFLAQAQAGSRGTSHHKSGAIQDVVEDLQKKLSDPGLSEEEAALAQILLKLHVDDRTRLLQLLPRLAGTEWDKVKVKTSQSGKEYLVWFRQDLSGEGGALTRLLSRPGVSANDFKPIVQTTKRGRDFSVI